MFNNVVWPFEMFAWNENLINYLHTDSGTDRMEAEREGGNECNAEDSRQPWLWKAAADQWDDHYNTTTTTTAFWPLHSADIQQTQTERTESLPAVKKIVQDHRRSLGKWISITDSSDDDDDGISSVESAKSHCLSTGETDSSSVREPFGHGTWSVQSK